MYSMAAGALVSWLFIAIIIFYQGISTCNCSYSYMKLATCLAPFYWSTIDPYSSLKFQIFSYTCIINKCSSSDIYDCKTDPESNRTLTGMIDHSAWCLYTTTATCMIVHIQTIRCRWLCFIAHKVCIIAHSMFYLQHSCTAFVSNETLFQ